MAAQTEHDFEPATANAALIDLRELLKRG